MIVKHLKRNSLYDVIGEADVQASTGPINEGDEVVIYRATNGKLFVRKAEEFWDGRFEQVEEPLKIEMESWSATDYSYAVMDCHGYVSDDERFYCFKKVEDFEKMSNHLYGKTT